MDTATLYMSGTQRLRQVSRRILICHSNSQTTCETD